MSDGDAAVLGQGCGIWKYLSDSRIAVWELEFEYIASFSMNYRISLGVSNVRKHIVVKTIVLYAYKNINISNHFCFRGVLRIVRYIVGNLRVPGKT
jgi:hypothetical protein